MKIVLLTLFYFVTIIVITLLLLTELYYVRTALSNLDQIYREIICYSIFIIGALLISYRIAKYLNS